MVLDREGNFTDFRAFGFHAYSNADDYLSDFLAEFADNAIVLIAVMDDMKLGGVVTHLKVTNRQLTNN